MKKVCIYILLFLIPYSSVKAQTLEWAQIFDVHSIGFGVDITPNSILKNDGTIMTVVVEDEILKLYKTLGDGTIIGAYNSNRMVEQFTPLINIDENEQAIVFKVQGAENNYRLLQTDTDFNITRDFELDFPIDLGVPRILHLISHGGSMNFTMFSGISITRHNLFRINTDNTITLIYSEDIGIPYGEDLITLDNSSIVFSFKLENEHVVRCVSLLDGQVLWEIYVHQNYGLLNEYKVLKYNDHILISIAVERVWVDGKAVDAIALKHIDAFTGTVLYEKSVELPDAENCFIDLHDFKYNPVNNHLYICYSSCFEEMSFSIVEVEIDGETIILENKLPYSVNLVHPIIGELANLYIMPDGEVVLIYSNYKDSVELGNLYISTLNHDLKESGTVEINFSSRNSSEYPTHFLSYDGSKIIVSGIVPDSSPFIFWEQVTFFTAMINLDILNSDENPVLIPSPVVLFPNPAENKVYGRVSDEIQEIIMYNASGKLIKKQKVNQQAFEIDISNYQPGVYFINILSANNNFTKQLIIYH